MKYMHLNMDTLLYFEAYIQRHIFPYNSAYSASPCKLVINLLWKYGICFGSVMLSVILIQRDDAYRSMYYFFTIKTYVPELYLIQYLNLYFELPGF